MHARPPSPLLCFLPAGIAVSTAELITTQLVTLLMIVDWHLSCVTVMAFWGLFSLIDASFLSANLVKVRRQREGHEKGGRVFPTQLLCGGTLRALSHTKRFDLNCSHYSGAFWRLVHTYGGVLRRTGDVCLADWEEGGEEGAAEVRFQRQGGQYVTC